MEDFNKRFKQLRISRNMTQGEVAMSLHLSRSTIAYYENGKRSPDMQKLLLIAALFDVSVDYLLCGNTDR